MMKSEDNYIFVMYFGDDCIWMKTKKDDTSYMGIPFDLSLLKEMHSLHQTDLTTDACLEKRQFYKFSIREQNMIAKYIM